MTNEINAYLESEDATSPFFLVVGDEDYIATKEKLSSALGLDVVVGLSKYCSGDRHPHMGRLKDDLKNGRIKVLAGLGEYLALCGRDTSFDTLSELQDFALGKNKVVLLLRCVKDTVKKLQANDLRFNDKRVLYLSDGNTEISLTCVPHSFDMPTAVENFEAVLVALENGATRIIAKTKMEFTDYQVIDVRTIGSAYECIKHWLPTFMLTSDYGSDDMWKELMSALSSAGGSLDKVFGNYGFSENIIEDFDLLIQGATFKSWLYFIALKIKASTLSNSYLKFVLEGVMKIEDLKDCVLSAIIDVPHTDTRFERFFKERKELVVGINEPDIAAFVKDNRIDLAESLYKLSDQTLPEREEIITLFGSLDRKRILKRIAMTYPALCDYLYPYSFSDPKVDSTLRELFTDYFDRYKWQKVTNKLEDEFIALVEDLALSTERKYNLLRSRNEIVNGIRKEKTKLYWLDALGVEFIGFIQATCNKLGLSLKIHIGRADLPSITSINKDFFDSWQGAKVSDKSLDETKHKGGDDSYDYRDNKLPIHLARELEIIATVLRKIAVILAKHDYDKILLASDHGASRLAVIKEQEEKYETNTTGEHSGRCCKTFPDYDLPFATEENGYLVLANYGRFKGSRKANVEVHGGASLEEVLVPIIEISLAKPNIKVQLTNANVYADYKTFAVLEIFSNVKLENVKVIIGTKPYTAVKKDDYHYTVTTDIKRAGKYQADIFDGDSLVGTETFTAQGKNRRNDDFDI